MVEIEYLPYRKIIVHEIRKLEAPAFFQFITAQVEAQKQGGTALVNWFDGIAFLVGEFIPSPESVAENLKGRLHYAWVFYTETSYQAEMRVTLNGRDYSVRLNNAGDNPNFVELVRFLKSFKS